MQSAVWCGARCIRAFKARNSRVFASVLHHQRARLCLVCYSLFSTSCLPHAHGFCFLVPLAALTLVATSAPHGILAAHHPLVVLTFLSSRS